MIQTHFGALREGLTPSEGEGREICWRKGEKLIRVKQSSRWELEQQNQIRRVITAHEGTELAERSIVQA